MSSYQASWPTIQGYGFSFLTESQWIPFPPNGPPIFGGLPEIYGTLLVAGLAMLLGIPLSLGIAMFLTELSPHILRAPLSFVIELLAAIPSVVYGVWGLLVLVPYMHSTVDPALATHLGSIPGLGAAFQANRTGSAGSTTSPRASSSRSWSSRRSRRSPVRRSTSSPRTSERPP